MLTTRKKPNMVQTTVTNSKQGAYIYGYTSKTPMLLADERNMGNFLAVRSEYHRRVCIELRRFGKLGCTPKAAEHRMQKNRDENHRRWRAPL
ncbi:MAG: hypothetical protein ABSG53_11230, partial [Thermoguttaceae bacterium]